MQYKRIKLLKEKERGKTRENFASKNRKENSKCPGLGAPESNFRIPQLAAEAEALKKIRLVQNVYLFRRDRELLELFQRSAFSLYI